MSLQFQSQNQKQDRHLSNYFFVSTCSYLINSNMSQKTQLAYRQPAAALPVDWYQRVGVREVGFICFFRDSLFSCLERTFTLDGFEKPNYSMQKYLVVFCEYCLNFLNHKLQRKGQQDKVKLLFFKESENMNGIKPTIC